MLVILLERIAKLGKMGETVSVKPGYARNYLFPQKKALRASSDNLAKFESQRADLKKRDLERRCHAEGVFSTLADKEFVIIRAASESGQLYGSVTPRNLSDILSESGFNIAKDKIRITAPIKNIGLYQISLDLHPDIEIFITINVARSADEASRQSQDLITVKEDDISSSNEVAIDATLTNKSDTSTTQD